MGIASRLRDETAFIAIALLLAYGIYQTAGVALGTTVPVVAVTSGSMEPTLHRGDMVIVRGTPFDRIQEGDIVVFDTGSECFPVPIIHRVVDRTGDTLETKGDNNPSQITLCQQNGRCTQTFDTCPASADRITVEKGITEKQVRGVVATTIPFLGHVKLVPTCAYLRLQHEHVPSTLCP